MRARGSVPEMRPRTQVNSSRVWLSRSLCSPDDLCDGRSLDKNHPKRNTGYPGLRSGVRCGEGGPWSATVPYRIGFPAEANISLAIADRGS